VALKTGAEVLTLTASPASKLGALAQGLVVIPAAAKQDHHGTRSAQYAGALFEQSVLLITDAMFHEMWQERAETTEELWRRHANLE
jgi:6-phospho-3-hexuloisomerase